MIWKFDTEAITFCIEQYADGGTTVEAWCENGVYATLSVNMPDTPPLPKGQFYLKNWSENERIAQAMIAEGIIEAVSPPVIAHSGFITATAYQFTELGMQYCGNIGGQLTRLEALTLSEPTDLAAQGTGWRVQPEESPELDYEAFERLYGFPRPEIDGLVQLLQQYYPGTPIQNRTVEWAVLKQRDREGQNALARARAE